MEALVYINGEIVAASQARVSVLDRGFLYGDGLFETMRSYGGRIHLLGRHLRRLRESAEYIALPLPTDDELINALRRMIEANGGGDMALRLTVTRGVGGTGTDISDCDEPTVLITSRPLLHNRDDTTKIITLSARRSMPEIGRAVKSLNYLTSVYAARELMRADVREGILLTHDGWVAEGTVSNLFCAHDDVLSTPSLELGILDGITRGRVIELVRAMGIEVREEKFTLDFLKSSNECFYTNSVREIVPVSSVDECVIGDGEIDAITQRLLNAYRAEAPDEWL